jgi:hypothetical protein
MIFWVSIGRLGRATPGREPLVGSQALLPPTQPLALALYGNICEEGREEMERMFRRHTQWKLRWMQWGVPEVVNHRDPVLTLSYR